VLATYTTLTGTAFATEPNNIPTGYELEIRLPRRQNRPRQTGGSSGFASWQAANSTTGGLADDHDNDGVANGIEYFLGGPNGNTTGFTPLPGVTTTAGTLSVTWTKGPGYTGTYGTHFLVETSATLTGTWTEETDRRQHHRHPPGFVKYTFPSPLGTNKFARLVVTGP
jgi:hypothetical protein